ncbi:MAG: S9 family peptidase [Verrucomicrobia bacterium]|nr:S9 family peptidase [Verrucomicrobiota bacterium]
MDAQGRGGRSGMRIGRAGFFVYHAGMSWRWILLAGVLAGCGKSRVDKSHLIDRELFFGNPALASPQVSPDGRWVAFLKERNGILNIHLAAWGQAVDSARALTDEKERPPAGFTWTRDSRYLLVSQDSGGDENYRLRRLDLTAPADPVTGLPAAQEVPLKKGARAMVMDLPKARPGEALIQVNERDEKFFDVEKLDIEFLRRTPVWENREGCADIVSDLDGNVRLATRMTADGGTELFRIEGKKLSAPILKATWQEGMGGFRFRPGNRTAYLETNVGEGEDLSFLAEIDPKTGHLQKLESDPLGRVDISRAAFSEATDELVGTVYLDDRKRNYWRDDGFASDFQFLKSQFPGREVGLADMSGDDRRWVILITADTDPGTYYLFDRNSRDLTKFGELRPDLPKERLSPMTPIRYRSSDGLEIPAYLTLPQHREGVKLPLLVMPHGGPWARDYWGYNPNAQFFANRGLAVLQPNFRQSTGYGKRFYAAGRHQWGEKMQDDLTWGVKHLVEKGIADPKRVAIYGGSYGGYAALAGLAFTPDVYAAGASFVGPSNLFTLLNSIPPYWESVRRQFDYFVGNPSDPADQERLKRQSPLFSADKMKAPLLVVQGANDPRVKKAESDQIVEAYRKKGQAVEYLVAADEGHGFARPDNRLAAMLVLERFLHRYVGSDLQREAPGWMEAKAQALQSGGGSAR